jgi:ubiquinone/menaquinone biosynthesis C-methylase UbiE
MLRATCNANSSSLMRTRDEQPDDYDKWVQQATQRKIRSGPTARWPDGPTQSARTRSQDLTQSQKTIKRDAYALRRPELVLPHPSDPAKTVYWQNGQFQIGDDTARVLSYAVAQSGWTEELTLLHEQAGGGDHFMDVASRRHATKEVARVAQGRPVTVLEVGVSSGHLLSELRESMPEAHLIGADYTRRTLDALGARLPDVPLIQFDLTRCPLPDNFADVTILLNVLEHIDNHEEAARQLYRITRPGGALIAEVPAGSHLYDVYDRVLMHHRRYDMPDLAALLQRAGFIVESRSHLGAILYPVFFAAKRLNQWRYGSNGADDAVVVEATIRTSTRAAPFAKFVMRAEEVLRTLGPLPFGIRCLVTCRKPNRDSVGGG